MWDLRGLDLKKLDIKGWDEQSESMPPSRGHRAGPEAKGTAPQEDAPGGQAPAPSRQPPALQDLVRSDFAQVLEQAISRCVSKLGRMQEERLNEMFHEQHILLDTSLRRFQNQLAEHAAANAAASSAIPVTTATEATMPSVVANIEAKVSRLVDLVEEGQSDLAHYCVRTKQAVSDAIGEKLDTALTELVERLPTEVRGVSVQDMPETPAQGETQVMATASTSSQSVLNVEPLRRSRDEDEEAPHGGLPDEEAARHGGVPPRMLTPAEMLRSMRRAQRNFLREEGSGSARNQSKETWAQTVIRSPYYELVVLLCVAVQVMLMVLEADRAFDRPFPVSSQLVFESVFLSLYTADLLLRIWVDQRDFFRTKLNILDAVLVLAGLIDVISLLVISDTQFDVGPMKALRILKLRTVLRLHRLFKLMPDFHLVLESLCFCGNALVGTAVFVFVYILVGAILTTATVNTFIRQAGAGALSEDRVAHYRREFGTVTACMLTLYQSVTSGTDWRITYEALDRIPGATLAPSFVVFHFVFHFLLLNMLTSIFVQKVMFLSTEDTQAAHYNTYLRDRIDTLELLGRCERKIGAGESMNYKEFLDFMLDRHVLRMFDRRHIKFEEARMIHGMLATKPVPGQTRSDEWMQTVNRADFLEACMRLKHDHMVVDAVMEKTLQRRHMEALREQGDRLSSGLEKVEKRLDVLSRKVRPPPF